MEREKVGSDEFWFGEEHRGAAMQIARFLPELRRRGEGIVGTPGPPSVRFVVTEMPPPALALLRFSRFFIGLCLAVALVVWGAAPFFLGGVALAIAVTVGQVVVWALALTKLRRSLRRSWPSAGALVMRRHPILEPAVAVHWPLPKRPAAAVPLTQPRPSEQKALESIVAHEYGHLLLRERYPSAPLPPWLDEGFAFWFSEQVTGVEFWSPQARNCFAEPEPERDPRRLFPYDGYYRLMARYYWEVRTLAEQGRLGELLHTPVSRIGKWRPVLKAPES